jgi:hypothetical protein
MEVTASAKADEAHVHTTAESQSGFDPQISTTGESMKLSGVSVIHLMAVFGITLVLIIPGCDHDTKVDGLQRQTQEMSKNIDELKKEVETLKRESSWDHFSRDLDKVAYLTPGDSGYSVIRTDFGSITVTIDDIKPYANGSRVSLRFGNPTSATLTDVSATVEWGSVDTRGSPKNDEARSKELPFNRSFQAGHWTTVDAVLEEVPPSVLGFVRIRDLKNKGIRLFQ